MVPCCRFSVPIILNKFGLSDVVNVLLNAGALSLAGAGRGPGYNMSLHRCAESTRDVGDRLPTGFRPAKPGAERISYRPTACLRFHRRRRAPANNSRSIHAQEEALRRGLHDALRLRPRFRWTPVVTPWCTHRPCLKSSTFSLCPSRALIAACPTRIGSVRSLQTSLDGKCLRSTPGTYYIYWAHLLSDWVCAQHDYE